MSEVNLFEKIRTAVMQGDAEQARALAADAMRARLDPVVVLERGFTASLRFVGDCWEKGEMFLPEMILAAEAVKAAMDELKPGLRTMASPAAAPAVCVLGTVKGDIHDIGKNIVGTMLQAFGFKIIDLGTDVDAERFVGAVRETGAGLVGLSALLTSTMPGMKTVVEALEGAGLRSRVRIAVGGAPISSAFAAEIGADGYAEDGASALRLFQRLAAGAPPPAAERPAVEIRDAL
ncbi:MAG TPA: corrinoid protein [Candidatus Polarisedimenticolia bacterium]|nr:corrinoid protein [Candidatus Polarisedimenticolia bacterium]